MSAVLKAERPLADALVQEGRLGRLAVARIKPNEGSIDSVDVPYRRHGIIFAVVRGAWAP